MLWHFFWFQPRNHHDDDDDFIFNALESIVCIQVALHVSDGEVLWKTCQLLMGRTGKKAAKKCSIFSYFFFLSLQFFFIFVVYLFKALGTSRNTLFFLVNYFFFLSHRPIYPRSFSNFLFNLNSLWLLL